MKTLTEIGIYAKKASVYAAKLNIKDKNHIIESAAEALIDNTQSIIKANEADVKAAKGKMPEHMIDRLILDEKRITDMADGLMQIAALQDPTGEFISMKTLPNGLKVGQKRVPMGVIAIIYEARPNVTSDAFGLCFKAGSAVILRGGSDALNSNKAIVDIFRKSAYENGFDSNIVQLVEDTSHESANELMKMNKYIDLLIPRGGRGLIQSVVKNATVPIIETGVGNCHIFVDKYANQDDAVNIIINAKVQRPSVCNAAESLLIHNDIANEFIPKICKALNEKNVEIRGDKTVCKLFSGAVEANEEDWGKEYLDYIISVKTVNSVDEAIEHISKYSTGHSEAIITENYTNADKFINEVDSAAVYVNASTRFTDGNEFGFGAEIGISTQKLHARGPMGLRELTTTKYIILGNGQIRN